MVSILCFSKRLRQLVFWETPHKGPTASFGFRRIHVDWGIRYSKLPWSKNLCSICKSTECRVEIDVILTPTESICECESPKMYGTCLSRCCTKCYCLCLFHIQFWSICQKLFLRTTLYWKSLCHPHIITFYSSVRFLADRLRILWTKGPKNWALGKVLEMISGCFTQRFGFHSVGGFQNW